MKQCGNCKHYQLINGKYDCTNDKSERYKTNPISEHDCDKFSKKPSHTQQELAYMQSLPLNIKVAMTRDRIRGWIDEYGEDGVYVSFSGGKDSTVLLDIVRKDYPNAKAVFVDTGLEYPEIRQFVKTFDNVDWLKPKMNFKQVIKKYGYPFISKEVSEVVDGAKRYLKSIFLGGAAKDYDCLNDYGQTDVVCDLYDCIDRAYLGITDKVFSKIKSTDFVFAFFPCTRFEDQIQTHYRGTAYQLANYTDEKKLQYDLYLHKQLSDNYERVTKLAIICLRLGVPLVIENPYSTTHYLVKYWAIPSKIIDMNRRNNGDYMKKPTQYWFINAEPKNNLVFEPLIPVEKCVNDHITSKTSDKSREATRSEIHPQYASRFIKQYIATVGADGKFEV